MYYNRLWIVVLWWWVDKSWNLNEHSKLRYDVAINYYHNLDKKLYDEIYFICSTGKSYRKEWLFVKTSEAQVWKQYLISKWINENIILKEEKSADTLSNAFYIKKLITDPLDIKNLIVITSKFHMKKSKFVFGVVWWYKPILVDQQIDYFEINGYNIKFIEAPNPISNPQALQNRIISEGEVLKFYKKHLFTTYKVIAGDMNSIENFLKNYNLATTWKMDKYQQQLTQLIQSKIKGKELLY